MVEWDVFFVGRELQNGVLGESQVKTEVNLKKIVFKVMLSGWC